MSHQSQATSSHWWSHQLNQWAPPNSLLSHHLIAWSFHSAVLWEFTIPITSPRSSQIWQKQKGEDRLFGDTRYLSEKSHKQTHPLTYPSDPLHPEKMVLPPSPAGAREELVWDLTPGSCPSLSIERNLSSFLSVTSHVLGLSLES